ncbi:DUF2946 domain-containing protein [Paraburkholderia fungorum]|uniref:DUF2946 domain-containing protein n=1 Tax=Paraburkholderia fungorum TaxID=134537 RepID=UPI0038BC7D31
MATLAPTVSQSLAARGSASTVSGEHCDMPSMGEMSSMDDMPAMQGNASDQDDRRHTQHSTMSDGDACGYCSLLAHMPAVPSVEALFAITVRVIQHPIATRFESVRRVEPLTFAQPRAPPFVS